MILDKIPVDESAAFLGDDARRPGKERKRGIPSTTNRSLIGEWLTRPLHLLWVAVLPQLLLLCLNCRAYRLVSGEMVAAQQKTAALTLAAELALLLGCGAMAIVLHTRRQPLAWSWNWPLLGAAIGYLAWITAQLFNLVPSNVPQWILSGGELLYYQYVLTMPLAFHAGLRLACFESNRSIWRDLGRTLLVGVTLFGAVFVFSQTLRFLPKIFFSAPTFVFVLLAIAMTLLLMGAVLRSLVIAYVGVRIQGPKAMAGLILLVGVVGPVGGLALNATIPFPVDLQGWQVYALAVLNGLLLLVPNHRNPLVHRLVWLSQCALFPFSLYFFLVFLPLLPLCLPAMFFLGAGLLLLVPSALFIVHSQRLVDGYRCEVRDGNRWTPALLGFGAALLIPTFYLGSAWLDRVVLRGALDYAYTPDYRAQAKPFPGNPARVGRSLEHLRDYKAGLDLPFLTDLYKSIVFSGLVLPDEKMQHLYQVFLGRALPGADTGRVSIFGHSSPTDRGRRTRDVAPDTEPPPPTASVVLANTEQTITPEGPCDRAHLTLTMENTTATPSEFVTQVHLPETVRITGFWLYVGPERVAGRLVERKTALWVYHRIRDAVVRRDPGIFLYTAPETAELRVYPFNAHERRTVELELLYPAALAPKITVGDRVVALRDPASTPADTIVMAPAGDAVLIAALTPRAIFKLSPVPRRPYLHFLVDCSADSDMDTAALRRAVQTAMARFPEAREGWLTLVNYECRDLLSPEPMPLASLSKALDQGALTPQLSARKGGFLQERALRRGLLMARDHLARVAGTDDPALTRYPVFVVVSGSHTKEMREEDEIGGGGSGGLKSWGEMVPDQPAYYTVTDGGTRLEAHRFGLEAEEPLPDEQVPQPVVLLRSGGCTVACAADANQTQMVRFVPTGAKSSGGGADLNVFDPSTRRFRPATDTGREPLAVTQIPFDSPYAHASEVFMRYRQLVEDPSAGSSGLTELTNLSRKSGVLTGATSYIVVENSAQWKILEQKEKQKLANAPALEIEQAPEPKVWAMIVLGALGIVAARYRIALRRGCNAMVNFSRG